jgi:ABC-type uncharacterized transport system involved in gliding motility auxiliary subunit
MTKKQFGIISVLTAAALILILLISRRLWFRLDLTRNKAYTISPVSRELYAEIPDQVRITYFVSDKLFSIHPVPGEIVDLLREYAAYSKGRIRFIRRDPDKAGLSQRVEQLGILPQQLETVEQNEARFATVYTGIVIEYLDKTEVLPVVFSLDTLEYDLTSRIRSLIRDTPREVGILLGDTDKQWDSDYGYLNQAFIQAGFRIRRISPGGEIPDTLPVLFVFGGAEELDEWALYRIDRYIQGGGKVFFSLEGVFVDTQNSLEGRVINDRGLLAMVSYYGATVKPALVLDRSALIIPDTAQGRFVQYPYWVGVLEQNGGRNPITAGFGGVDLFWCSPLELNPPEQVEAEPLFTSTPEAWLMTEGFTVDPAMGYLFEREEPDTRGEKILGAALGGKFPSWFEGTPKPVREGSGEELPDMPPEAKYSRIVVVGDTDMGTTLIQYRYGGGRRNLDFFLQAADWLGNDDDIIGIRSRLPQAGRLNKIIDPLKRVQVMGLVQLLNVVAVPLAVIIFGVFRAWKRRPSGKGGRGKELSDVV